MKMIIISKYSQEKKDGKIYIHTEESSVCPVCGTKLQVIGSRNRKVIGADGTWQTLVIRRLRCKKCEQVHHELPDLLVPYKRYCAETIEQVILEKKPTSVKEHTTILKIRSWWQGIIQYFNNIQLSLEMKYNVHFPELKKLSIIVRALVNSHLWTQTRSATLSG